MWINSPNRVDKTDAVSPLNHDVSGAFSRKGKAVKKSNKDPQWFDTLLIILFIFLLSAIDFILFAGSGNLRIISSYCLPIPEVGIVLGGILITASILILPFHQKRMIKYCIAAVISVLFVYIVFRQFFLYHQGLSLGKSSLSISLLIALLFGSITYAVFQQKRVFFKILYVIAFAVMLTNVYTAYREDAGDKDFEETYNAQQQNDADSERFVYFMLPNLESYAYLSTINTNEAKITQDIMQGFYQKNKFIVFAKAYVPENSYIANMIRGFNPTSDEISSQHRMNTKLLERYWSFHNLKNEYVLLKNNELYDIFRSRGYQISAYKSRDFDMCNRQHQIDVERCVEKINKPINLYNTKLSLLSKAGILAIEWLNSTRLFNDASFVYGMLGKVMNIEDLPMLGTDFNNLYVVNADKTFDILYDNIKKDTGKQAYFVFIDLPSDMYIYDEYCQIKPQNQWVSMVNLPWIKRDYKDKRQKAYLQQTRCLFGKLAEFMDNMRAENMLENTTVIIQGTSGTNDFAAAKSEVSAEQIFNNRVVNMAIYDDKNQKYKTDERFCATNHIMTEYLFPEQKCEIYLTDYHQKMVETINGQLDLYNRNINTDRTAFFADWYNNWKQHNKDTTDDSKIDETADFNEILEENK